MSLRDHHKQILRPILGLGRDRYVFAVYHPGWLVTTPGVLISVHIVVGVIFSGRKQVDTSKTPDSTRIPNLASKTGAILSYISRY